MIHFFKKMKRLCTGPSELEKARQSVDSYISYLRKQGIAIGVNCNFFDPNSTVIDLTRPELITIGDKVNITREVTILTHGFDWCVLRELHPGEIFGSAGAVTIGNNVFIGMRSIILKNCRIGNNCVIGAGSVVSGEIPDNAVAAGNPAKPIMSIDTLYEKYLTRQLSEAKLYAQAIIHRRNRLPDPTDFKEFFFLFATCKKAESYGIDVKHQTSATHYKIFSENHKPRFTSFNEFLKYCDL